MICNLHQYLCFLNITLLVVVFTVLQSHCTFLVPLIKFRCYRNNYLAKLVAVLKTEGCHVDLREDKSFTDVTFMLYIPDK